MPTLGNLALDPAIDGLPGNANQFRYARERETLVFRQCFNSPLKNGNLLRQQKNPDRLCMRNTLRALDFFASLHLTIFERAANFEFFNSLLIC